MSELTRLTPAAAGFLIAVSTLSVMMSTAVAPAAAVMAEHLTAIGEDDARLKAKLLIVAPAASVALLAAACGWLNDRLGRRSVLLGSLLVFALAGTTGLYLQTFVGLLLGRFALGMAGAGMKTSVLAIVADRLTGHEQTRFLGLQSAFMGLGAICFIVLGGVLQASSWRWPFVMYVAALPLLALAPLMLPATAADRGSVSKVAVLTHPIPPRRTAAVLVTGFLSMAIFYVALTQLPFILVSSGLGGPLIGVALGVFSLGAVLAGLCFGIIRRRYDARQTFARLFLLWAIGYGAVAISSHAGPATLPIILVSLLTAGFAGGLALPNCISELYQITPAPRRGLMIGALTSSFFMGECLSPLLFQPAIHFGHESAAFAVASLLLLILCLLYVTHLKLRP